MKSPSHRPASTLHDKNCGLILQFLNKIPHTVYSNADSNLAASTLFRSHIYPLLTLDLLPLWVFSLRRLVETSLSLWSLVFETGVQQSPSLHLVKSWSSQWCNLHSTWAPSTGLRWWSTTTLTPSWLATWHDVWTKKKDNRRKEHEKGKSGQGCLTFLSSSLVILLLSYLLWSSSTHDAESSHANKLALSSRPVEFMSCWRSVPLKNPTAIYLSKPSYVLTVEGHMLLSAFLQSTHLPLQTHYSDS